MKNTAKVDKPNVNPMRQIIDMTIGRDARMVGGGDFSIK